MVAQKNLEKVSQAELKAFLTAYDSRDNTIGAGMRSQLAVAL